MPVVARQQPVREVMRERQRELAAEGDAVIEGRDIGAVVVPGAEVKVYLVADEGERARRRSAERPGHRHRRARHRPARPRRERRGADAAATTRIEIDTTDLSVDEVVDRVEARVRALQRA